MLAFTNQYLVVLDACVLAPMPLCDTLLRLAEEPAFYIPKWSAEILDEVRRTIEKWGYSPIQTERRIESMTRAFEDALVTGYEPLVDIMENHVDDRHVLATAVKCGANAIVTENTKDFPRHCLEPYGIEPMRPDDFLIHQFHFDKDQMLLTLERQAAKTRSNLPTLLTRLKINAPEFVSLLANSLKD